MRISFLEHYAVGRDSSTRGEDLLFSPTLDRTLVDQTMALFYTNRTALMKASELVLPRQATNALAVIAGFRGLQKRFPRIGILTGTKQKRIMIEDLEDFYSYAQDSRLTSGSAFDGITVVCGHFPLEHYQKDALEQMYQQAIRVVPLTKMPDQQTYAGPKQANILGGILAARDIHGHTLRAEDIAKAIYLPALFPPWAALQFTALTALNQGALLPVVRFNKISDRFTIHEVTPLQDIESGCAEIIPSVNLGIIVRILITKGMLGSFAKGNKLIIVDGKERYELTISAARQLP